MVVQTLFRLMICGLGPSISKKQSAVLVHCCFQEAVRSLGSLLFLKRAGESELCELHPAAFSKLFEIFHVAVVSFTVLDLLLRLSTGQNPA